MGHLPAGGGCSEGFLHTLLDIVSLHIPGAYCRVPAVVGSWGLGTFDLAMAAMTASEATAPEGDGGLIVRSSTGKWRKGGGGCCGEGTCNPGRRSSPPVVERVWGVGTGGGVPPRWGIGDAGRVGGE